MIRLDMHTSVKKSQILFVTEKDGLVKVKTKDATYRYYFLRQHQALTYIDYISMGCNGDYFVDLIHVIRLNDRMAAMDKQTLKLHNKRLKRGLY